jgi:hypothetical protein
MTTTASGDQARTTLDQSDHHKRVVTRGIMQQHIKTLARGGHRCVMTKISFRNYNKARRSYYLF